MTPWTDDRRLGGGHNERHGQHVQRLLRLQQLRLADSSSRRAIFRADAAALNMPMPVIGSCVMASEPVRHTIGAECSRSSMQMDATLVPVTYARSMLIVGTNMPGVMTKSSQRVSAETLQVFAFQLEPARPLPPW